MRRYLSAIAVAGLIMGMTVIPVVAQDGSIRIAIPDYIPVNGSLDMVVRTGGSSDVVHSEYCMGGGDHLRSPVVILDQSQQVAGRYTGILIDHDIPEGTRITDMIHYGYCTGDDGTSYRTYIGLLGSG